MFGCLVLAFGLCFAGKDVQATASDFGMGRTLSVTAEHYTVHTAITDVIDMHDFRKAPMACADDRCIRYHKHCAPADKGIVCEYRVVWPSVVPDGLVRITAENDTALDAAEHEVSLIFTRDGKTVKLPFAMMTVRDKAEAPPECTNADYDACDPG